MGKRTVAVVEKDGARIVVTKGAPQVLIHLAKLSRDDAEPIEREVELLAEKGYRTLAVAREEDGRANLVGLIPLFDPPREDSKDVIADLHGHGVTVKMITGDNLAIAREIGSLLGLGRRALRSTELRSAGHKELATLGRVIARALYERLHPEVDEDEARRFANEVVEKLTEEFQYEGLTDGFITAHESEILAMIEDAEIFAEVIPEDKYRIVELLQKADHIVAMTGDGVNDAPALKKADAGIAVANATDAARAAADIVLTAPGLSVINEAIKQARITFERMKSYSIFRIAETLRIVAFMTLAIVVFDFYPITALMIIILALLNDIPILTIAYDNTRVRKHPVRWNMPEILWLSSVLGLAGVISSFLLFYILVKQELPAPLIQSIFFAKMVVAGHGTIYNTRINDWFWPRASSSARPSRRA